MSRARTQPRDFDDVWRGLRDEARRVDVWPRLSALRLTADPRHEVVTFTSGGGRRIGGFLVRPEGEPTSAVIVGHGYAGRGEPGPAGIPESAVAFYPVCRGLPRLSRQADLPSDSWGHVLAGIESREQYVHGGCAMDIWCAADVLEQVIGLPLGERRGGLRLGYLGASFGGGIGALALPWDDRFDAAALHIPSFGNNEERLRVPSHGSGGSLRLYLQEHPEAWEVLDYFDAAWGAERLRIPTIIAPAHRDPAVAPVGQWAIANAVPSEFSTIIPLTAGHESYKAEAAEMKVFYTAARRLFTP